MRLAWIGRAPASYDATFMARMAGVYLDQTPWTRLRLAAVRELLRPQPGERVLDLGSAGGAMTHFASTFGCRAVGLDAEPAAVETATRTFPSLRFELADVTALPFSDESFDKAVAADLVEHLADADLVRMLAEVFRVLVPGGTLVVYTPNPRHPIEVLKKRDLVLARNETHIALRDSPALVAQLRRAGFVVEREEWRAGFLPGLRTLERLAGGRVPALRYRLCLLARRPADQAPSPDREPGS
jgi:cyclopropane fatty-acyl-phospholipid synthase-like methyltransferase